MPGRNQPRSSRGRSAIARVAINTGNTNGFMYQGTCVAEDGTKITPCRNFGGMKKGGARPSATGFMRARPWQISVPAKRKNFIFRMNTSQVTTEQAKSTAVCTLDSHCPEYHYCRPDHELADKITGCMKDDDMHVDDTFSTAAAGAKVDCGDLQEMPDAIGAGEHSCVGGPRPMFAACRNYYGIGGPSIGTFYACKENPDIGGTCTADPDQPCATLSQLNMQQNLQLYEH